MVLKKPPLDYNVLIRNGEFTGNENMESLSLEREKDELSIRFIPFLSFKNLGRFPRFPDHKELTVSWGDLRENYNDGLFIFISHCWLRGWPGADGWDGKPHPDDAVGSKFLLCVEGIEKVLQTLAPGMKECFLWIDFGCIDQDGDPAGELRMLDKIVEICDLLFTPIHDENHASWEIRVTHTFEGWYADYQSPAWKEGPYAYLSRGWCRIEMFYGSNIPVREDTKERRDKMRAGLLFHRNKQRRPHILYGTKQQVVQYGLIILPPLQNSLFVKYNPSSGVVTKESDRVIIERLVQELQPFMKPSPEGYQGDRNTQGQRHGKGFYTFPDGSTYEGDWKDDQRHGIGDFHYVDGGHHVGSWAYDERSGPGKYIYADGSIYEGNYLHNFKHGQGVFIYANGNRYEGEYFENRKHGQGKWFESTSRTSYEGGFAEDVRHGLGKVSYPDGRIALQQYDHGKLLSEESISINHSTETPRAIQHDGSTICKIQ